jgi:tetratricopeptide (TPR) repeat protein
MPQRATREPVTDEPEDRRPPAWGFGYSRREGRGSPRERLRGGEEKRAERAKQGDASADRSGERRRGGPRFSLLDAVEAGYRREGHWEDLIELYLKRLESASEPTERAALLKRIGFAFRDGMNDPEQAFDALLEVFRLDPLDEAAAAALEQAARLSHRETELLTAIEDMVVLEKDDARVLRMCEHAVRFCRLYFASSSHTEPFVARIRKIDPSHPAVHRRMASQYREHGVWDAQRDALLRALLSAKDSTERRQIHVALAELFEARFDNVRAALEHWEGALAEDAACVEALRGIERASRALELFPKLADVLDKQAAMETNPVAKVDALLRAAELQETHFLKPQLAAPKLEEALALDPKNPHVCEALERCYRSMRAWPELIQTLERHVRLETGVQHKVRHLTTMAEVLEGKLGDANLAMAAFLRVHELEPRNTVALAELSRLAERRGDWANAAVFRSRLAKLTESPHTRAQIHVAIGELLAPEDRDPARAKRHFERAVAIEPSNAAAWEALQRFALREGDASRAAECLLERAQNTEGMRSRASLFVELAELRKTRLDDERGALAAYEAAHRADPTNEASIFALSAAYAREQRWGDALPLAEQALAVAVREGEKGPVLETATRVVAVATALGKPARALDAAVRAFELTPKDVEWQKRVVELAHAVREQPRVLGGARAALDLIAKGSSDLPAPSLVALAEVLRSLGDFDLALETLCKAVALDGEHIPALQLLCTLLVERGEWARACSCKERIADASTDREERLAAMMEAGDIWLKRAGDKERAAAAYERAREIDPTQHVVLHTLARIYTDTEQWAKLATILRAIVAIEETNARRATALFALAQVVRDKLREPHRAAQVFEEAVAEDPSRLDAFERAVRLYTELRDFRALAAAYEAMLARTAESGDAKLRHALLYQLGLVQRDRLGGRQRALEAFQEAARLRPDDEKTHAIIRELLVAMNRVGAAIEACREHARATPLSPKAYHELFELFVRERAFDKAWCAASVLSHLGALTEEQAAFFATFRSKPLWQVPGTLASSAWESHLFDAALDPALTTVLTLMTAAVIRAQVAKRTAKERAALGVPLDEHPAAVVPEVRQAFVDACEVLGVTPPILLAVDSGPAPLAVVAAEHPTVVCAIEPLDALPRDTLPFLVGRVLAELQPELAPRAFFPTVTELRSLLATALRFARGTQDPAHKRFDAELRRTMAHDEIAELRAAVARLTAASPQVDIAKWLRVAGASSARVGLLLAGDVDAAYRGMQRGGHGPSDLTPTELRKELLFFAVSDAHAELREAIGVAIEA